MTSRIDLPADDFGDKWLEADEARIGGWWLCRMQPKGPFRIRPLDNYECEYINAALRSAGERVREAAARHCESRAGLRGAGAWAALTAVADEIRALPVPGEVNAPTEPPLAGTNGAGEWLPIETAPKDNKRPLLIARFNDDGTLQSIDHDAVWESDRESWEIPQVYYFWASAHGLVEEPSHWMYQPDWYAKLSPSTAGESAREEG